MYLPKPKSAPKENPLKIKMAKRHLVAIGNLVFLCSVLGAYYLIGVVQGRKRPSDAKLNSARAGKKVIIVGGGAGGCAVASALTSQDADLNVVVFEPQTFSQLQTMMPLAHVGSRSYDLNTNDGRDTLFSPTAWNVTRDAKLVMRSVVSVDPKACTVLDSDGDTHSYDYLVVAAGTQPDFGAVPGLTASHYNRFRIAQDSYATRDSLVHLYEGHVVHAKVPPRDPAALFNEGIKEAASVILKTSAATQKQTNHVSWWRRLGGGGGTVERSSPRALSGDMSTTSMRPTAMAQQFVGQQHCGTFISTTNTLWKYLNYFRKDERCPLTIVSTESAPSDALPQDYQDAVEALWKERHVNFLGRTRIDRVDPLKHKCILRNMDTGASLEIVFRLLLLDLPRRVSGWVAHSGLSRPDLGGYVDVNPQTLQHVAFQNIFALGDCAAVPTIPSYGAVFTQAPIVAHNIRQHMFGRPLTAHYDGYSSFNVIMTTWRHMWPEVSWNDDASQTQREGRVNEHHLVRRNEHVWDNAKWRDIRGVLQGAYVQWFGLEIMHWFVFLRYGWYPPHWFQMPIFPVTESTVDSSREG